MNIISLTLKEIGRRKAGAVIGLIAVTCSIGVIIAIRTMSESSKLQIRKITKRLGNNLLIIPGDSEIESYYTCSGFQGEMPEDYVETLANAKAVLATDYIAKLQQRIVINGANGILTGVRHIKGPLDEKRKVDLPKDKQVYLGSEIAKRLKKQAGDAIAIHGQSYHVTKVLPEYGNVDDLRVYIALPRMQALMKKPNIIHGIDALECLCAGELPPEIKMSVARVLPDVHTISFTRLASTRSDARYVVESTGRFIFVAVLILGGLAMAVQGVKDVLERRHEIGIFMAMGARPVTIIKLFLCKFFLLGFLGGIAGFCLGTFLAVRLGPDLLKLTYVKSLPIAFLGLSVVMGVVFACFASAYPIWKAAGLDPAVVLREE